jgi:hypothetical protein
MPSALPRPSETIFPLLEDSQSEVPRLRVSKESFRPEQLDLFWRFVSERQWIWHRRFVEMRKPPWTEDVILQKVRFTNVYRELDPGTEFAIHQILEKPISAKDKIFNIMLYRLIGNEETFLKVGLQSVSGFDRAKLASGLKFIRDIERKRPFSNAYIVSSYVQMGSHDKIENVAKLFSKLVDRFEDFFGRLMNARSAEDAFLVIREMYGFGDFLAYQILVDLLYPIKSDGGRVLGFSHDDWAVAGPGARRGIDLLLRAGTRANELEVMRWLQLHQRTEFKRLKLEFPYLTTSEGNQVEISLSNIENCLCEFNKYVNAASRGRIRRKFVASTTQSLSNWIRTS